jgi:glycosyltransferase involved in cell wall biosynthesis
MGKRRKVLLIPDFKQWILGTIAQEIEKWNQQFECLIASAALIRKYPERFSNISDHFEVIHFIAPHDYGALRAILGENCAHVASVNHVDEWDEVKECTGADALMVAASEWKSYLMSKGIPESKIFLVPYGVDSDCYRPAGRMTRQTLRRRYGIPRDCFVIGFFNNLGGRKDALKGVDIFMKAFKELREKAAHVGVLFAGSGWGAMIDEIRRLGSFAAGVTFAPEREMPSLFNVIDCYWVTSRIEGGPVALLEAMSCGVPVITTPVGMARDVAADGENAFVVPRDDYSGFVETTMRLIDSDTLRDRIAANARRTALKSCQWSHSLERIPSLYETAISNHHGERKKGESESPVLRDRRFLTRRVLDIEDELVWVSFLLWKGERKSARDFHLRLCLRHPFSFSAWLSLLRLFGNPRAADVILAVKNKLLVRTRIIRFLRFVWNPAVKAKRAVAGRSALCRRKLRERYHVFRVRKLPPHFFHIVSSFYNAERYIENTLQTVYEQRYEKKYYRHILINDASTDGSDAIIRRWLDTHPDSSVHYIVNEKRIGGCANNTRGFRMAGPGTIVLELNGGDWLPDRRVLAFMNMLYFDEDIWMTYNSVITHKGERLPFFKEVPTDVVESGSIREHQWRTSGLHSFRAELFSHVKEEDLIDPETGDYWRRAWDLAHYFPMFEMARSHAKHVDRITYVYEYDENDPIRNAILADRAIVEKRIKRMPRYKALRGLSWNYNLQPFEGGTDTKEDLAVAAVRDENSKRKETQSQRNPDEPRATPGPDREDSIQKMAAQQELIDSLNAELAHYRQSRAWKWIKRAAAIRDRLVVPFRTMRSARDLVRCRLAARRILREIGTRSYWIIFPPAIQWRTKVFQRPHQIATAMAARGVGTIFISSPEKHPGKTPEAVQRICPDLLVVHQRFENAVRMASKRYRGKIILQMHWPNNFAYLERLRWDLLLYEYIDEVDVLPGYSRDSVVWQAELFRRADLVVATSTILHEKAKSLSSRTILCNNAGDYEFFSRAKSFRKERREVIIGFFGALARWLDYDLLKYAAGKRPEWRFVLVGPEFDDHTPKMHEIQKDAPNIEYWGPKEYQDLPRILAQFDIAIIPFKVFRLTKSMNPVKVFEYMAGGKPIVSTALPECEKYKSVLIARTKEEFVQKLEEALALKGSPDYLALLDREARENTWAKRVDQILEGLGILDDVREASSR